MTTHSMLDAMPRAMLHALPFAYAPRNARQAMHERTDERTYVELTYLNLEAFCLLTRTQAYEIFVNLSRVCGQPRTLPTEIEDAEVAR